MASVIRHPMFREILAPTPFIKTGLTIFLAGSIAAPPNWQSKVVTRLAKYPLTILNPYRSDWNASWKEDVSYPPFVEQVSWELDGLERADIIMVFFEAGTQAPITLMELGLNAKDKNKRIMVGCQDGYWKKGNVEMVCRKYGIEFVDTWENLVHRVERVLNEKMLNQKDFMK